MSKNAIVGQITSIISTGLNKPVNDAFSQLFIRYFQKTGSLEDFLTYSQALGFPQDGKLAKEVYKIINNNIEGLSRALQAESSNDKVGIKRRVEHLTDRKPQKKHQMKIDLDIDDDIDDNISKPLKAVDGTTKVEKLKSLPQGALFDEEDVNLFGTPLNSDPTAKRKPMGFKKIKKSDALKFKQEYIDSPSMNSTVSAPKLEPIIKVEPPAQNKQNLSLSELSALERKFSEPQVKEEKGQDFLEHIDDGDLENDREWYMSEEIGHAPAEYNDVEDEIYTTSRSGNQPRIRAQSKQSGSGGGFDSETGMYRDYDHEDSDESNLARIQITSHFFIPPFLEQSQQDLSLQIGAGSAKDTLAKGLNTGLSVIKDDASELAISSRRGSPIVKEKKTKREKAQQAKERSTLQGTALGNVLAIDDDKKGNNQDVTSQNDNEDGELTAPLTIQQQRRSLPAFAVKSSLMRALAENQVTVVIGETGSGKTTQLAQFLYEEGFGSSISKDNRKQMIGCTQPRRVAAMSVAKRVSEEMGCKLGEEVGYAIRFEDKTDAKKTVIKYMTDGVLMREILVDPTLDNYSCIIMDEAHERSLNTDVLLGLFKKLLMRRKDLKLIVTSATMNADRFTKFFGDAPQFTIPGRTFPVDIMFSKTSCNDYVETAVKQVLTIHLQNSANSNHNDGDILVFMTGQEDIEVTCELLQEKLDMLDDPPPLDIYPIYSTLPADLQKKIFNKKNDKRRKVVIATNIAETSLTVDGVKYVIDTGLVKMKIFNPKLGMETLQVVPISLANAQQRSGRAGRTGPGVAYRLYTERSTKSDQMYLQPIPEIQRTNLSNVMLLLKSLKVDEIPSFPFLDPPPKDLLACSLYELWSIGALDNLGDLTPLGNSMSSFPMEPTLSKLILLSCRSQFHCSEEILTIVSMLSIPSVFYRPKERATEADAIREKFVIAESDHLTLLNVYNQWVQQLSKPHMNYKKLTIWCGKNFLQIKSLLRARDIRNQLELIMKKNKVPISSSRSDDDIRKCICAAYYQSSAKLVKTNISKGSQAEYANLRHTYMSMYIHPTSALNGGTDMAPDYVVYHELVLTAKEYMNCITAVDPLWLLEFGSCFYGVTPETKQKLEDVVGIKIIDQQTFANQIEHDKLRYQDKVRQSQMKKGDKNANQSARSKEVKNKFNRRRAF